MITWVPIQFHEMLQKWTSKFPITTENALLWERPYPLKYLGTSIAHWYDNVNTNSVKLKRASLLFLLVQNFISMKTLISALWSLTPI